MNAARCADLRVPVRWRRQPSDHNSDRRDPPPISDLSTPTASPPPPRTAALGSQEEDAAERIAAWRQSQREEEKRRRYRRAWEFSAVAAGAFWVAGLFDGSFQDDPWAISIAAVVIWVILASVWSYFIWSSYCPPPYVVGDGGTRRIPVPQGTRRMVFARDNYQCVDCGSVIDLSIDHIQPVSSGGSNEPSNLQTLCQPCNSVKGDAWYLS